MDGFRIKNTNLHLWLRYPYYGGIIIDKVNNSCANEIFDVNINLTKMAQSPKNVVKILWSMVFANAFRRSREKTAFSIGSLSMLKSHLFVDFGDDVVVELGFRNPNWTLTSSCTSGEHSVKSPLQYVFAQVHKNVCVRIFCAFAYISPQRTYSGWRTFKKKPPGFYQCFLVLFVVKIQTLYKQTVEISLATYCDAPKHA